MRKNKLKFTLLGVGAILLLCSVIFAPTLTCAENILFVIIAIIGAGMSAYAMCYPGEEKVMKAHFSIVAVGCTVSVVSCIILHTIAMFTMWLGIMLCICGMYIWKTTR